MKPRLQRLQNLYRSGTTVAYFLARRFNRLGEKAGVLIALGMVLAIGFSRIYLGVHYLSDVLAGYMAGLFWLALCISALEMVSKPENQV